MKNTKAYEIGQLLAKISIVVFLILMYCLISTLDFKMLICG